MNPYGTLCDHTYQNQLEFPPRPDPHQPQPRWAQAPRQLLPVLL